MSLDVVSFGCRLNAHESDAIRAGAEAAGLGDVAIVNTCAVTAEAVRQARQAIRRIARNSAGTRIVVTGCAAQTDAESFAAMPEVARVVGNGDKLRGETWRDLRAALARAGTVAAPADKIAVGDVMAETAMTPVPAAQPAGRPRAFVPIQNGCDHRCTFCIIPFGRGNSRSQPMDAVIAEVRKVAAGGYPEAVLTGVDITSYGSGLPGAPTLGMLVKRILTDVPELARLRLTSIDPVEADADLIDAIATEPRLMPHLHLSLQAGDDLILKRMKRRHRRADAIAFCDRVRRLRPGIVFGADIIAGFPTETEAMFARSLDFVDACGLTHLHVFPYSPRPGTPAARMPQVAHGAIKDRARRLREKGDTALTAHLAGEIGARRRVLAESASIARTEPFTPVRLGMPAAPGEFRDVTITGHDGRALIAA